MGLEDENGPPKKKLKQAQLCFGSVTLKSQKRKLSSDSNDDIHANKIVCKETEKENVVINSTSLCALSESGKKVEDKKELDSESQNSEKLNTPISDAIVDLTKDVISTSQNKEVEVKDDDTSLRDFSLVISDSVLNSINNKSVGVDSSNGIAEDEKNKEENDSRQNCLISIEVESDDAKEDLADKTLSLDESFNRTLNSEDDDFAFSSEDSPKTKSSPGNIRKLTPKRLESIKRKEERERLRQERIALKTKAKEEKLKLKQEKEDLKRKEREEKEKKRQAELKIKEEEKRLKEEERKKKEEEKKLKDEERKQKEEEKRRKEEAKEEEKRKKEEMTEKEKAAFVNFFITKKKQQPEATDNPKESEEITFMPFAVKSDMRLASNARRVMSCEEKANLDSTLSGTQEENQDLYLKELKNGAHLPLRSEATWPVVSQEEEHDVIIIESTTDGECIDLTNTKEKEINNKKKMKAKLLQFHDNRRPPYWGTWRKKSAFVSSRKPLGLDKKIFDYEVDSDSEWEDEGEGEDIDKAGDSDEEQGDEEENQNSGENGYLLDNTFVPHGYLSDEEVHPDEEVDENNPENIKLRMKLLKQEFDEEMRSKTERLKPRLLGCVWISNGTTEVSPGSLYETLLRFRAVWNEEAGTIDFSGPEIEESPTSLTQTKCKPFPAVVLPVLAKFVHGNNLPLSGLIREFLLIVEKDHPTENITKRAVSLKIKEIAAKTFDSSGKSVWAVNPDLCKEYDLKVINNSKCITPPSPVVPEKPKESLLVNFLKGTHTPQPIKKRVALIPVPQDESTPIKKENEKTVHVATPRPSVGNVFKKRAQLITLSRTPDSSKNVTPVHIDTPRPSHVPPKVNIETIDLTAD